MPARTTVMCSDTTKCTRDVGTIEWKCCRVVGGVDKCASGINVPIEDLCGVSSKIEFKANRRA